MIDIKTKLDHITNAWNDFFLNYGECQKHIRFNEDVQTNYYGDILSYFNDTLDILETIKYSSDFNESILQAIGVLQIIFAQQDMMDELLYIFKTQASSGVNKSLNRTIRNQLIGHPIRKREGKLMSSVFYTKEFSNGTLAYVLYSQTNNFRGEDVVHHLDEIILRHKKNPPFEVYSR